MMAIAKGGQLGTMDAVFKALADPTRRQLLDSLNAEGGQNLRELCAGLEMARQSVTKHLAILEAAELVVTVRRGRERLHYLNAAPIDEIASRWIDQYHQARVHALAGLKHLLEDSTVETNSFVYKTYIKTTPEQLWRGLTDPAFTERYWGNTFETDWKVGSTLTWQLRGVRIADPEQQVLEYDPYRRLAYTWHTFTPELAPVIGLSEELSATLAAERRSKVAFELEDLDGVVKLTVVHDGFQPDSVAATMVREGWPHLLSDLKTLLETGDTLPASA
jgi:uncharacterized protein YndB with AHSA1/START domain/DNA-binding transcriptional ArsR family regulator